SKGAHEWTVQTTSLAITQLTLQRHAITFARRHLTALAPRLLIRLFHAPVPSTALRVVHALPALRRTPLACIATRVIPRVRPYHVAHPPPARLALLPRALHTRVLSRVARRRLTQVRALPYLRATLAGVREE